MATKEAVQLPGVIAAPKVHPLITPSCKYRVKTALSGQGKMILFVDSALVQLTNLVSTKSRRPHNKFSFCSNGNMSG